VKKRDSPSPGRKSFSFIKWENQLENLAEVRNSLIIIGCLVVIARLIALSPSKAHTRVAKRCASLFSLWDISLGALTKYFT
jgi:hypothetical protein